MIYHQTVGQNQILKAMFFYFSKSCKAQNRQPDDGIDASRIGWSSINCIFQLQKFSVHAPCQCCYKKCPENMFGGHGAQSRSSRSKIISQPISKKSLRKLAEKVKFEETQFLRFFSKKNFRKKAIAPTLMHIIEGRYAAGTEEWEEVRRFMYDLPPDCWPEPNPEGHVLLLLKIM